MPKRDNLLKDLQGEHDMGVLLVAQMGGVPEEIQLIIQTTTYDESVSGLREKSAYIVRALGVKEHRITLGVFTTLFFAKQHPILLHHNEGIHQIAFAGKPQDPNELVLDIQAAYSATFGPWRDIAEDINREKPLFDLVQSGGGVLGSMPKSAAERMVRVFDHHNMSATLTEVERERGINPEDKGTMEQSMTLLGIDDSYIIAYSFSVDPMGKR